LSINDTPIVGTFLDIREFEISPNGQFIIIAETNIETQLYQLYLYDAETGSLLVRWEAYEQLTSIDFSSDTQYLLFAGMEERTDRDTTITILDMQSLITISTLPEISSLQIPRQGLPMSIMFFVP